MKNSNSERAQNEQSHEERMRTDGSRTAAGMRKYEFFMELYGRLEGLSEEDRKRSADYYAEMIDDRMEEGLSEEEAVAAVGSPEEIARGILSEVPPSAREERKPRKRWSPMAVVLLILGAPLWIPLLAAAACILLAVLIVIVAAAVSFFAADLALAAGGAAGLLGGVLMLGTGHGVSGVFLIGGGLVCGGLAVLLFLGLVYVPRGILWLCKITARWIGSLFRKKEETV